MSCVTMRAYLTLFGSLALAGWKDLALVGI